MRRITMFSLAMLLAVTSVASTVNGRAQDGSEGSRPRRAWVGEMDGALFERGSYMGITLGEVNAETARRLRLAEERGALVSDVIAGGPAAQAGLKKDDVIVRWNSQPVESASQLTRHRQETPAGRTVRLGVLRDGREMELDIKLGERQTGFGRGFAPVGAMTLGEKGQHDMFFSLYDRGRLGAALQSLTPQLADYFGLSGRKGVLVSSVSEGSAAAKGGLQAGDIILSVGGEDIGNPMEVGRALRKKDEGSIDIKVLRNKQERSLTIQLEKRQGPSWQGSSAELGELFTAPMEFSFDMPAFDLKEFHFPRIDLNELKFFDGDMNLLPSPNIVIPKNLNRNRIEL